MHWRNQLKQKARQAKYDNTFDLDNVLALLGEEYEAKTSTQETKQRIWQTLRQTCYY